LLHALFISRKAEPAAFPNHSALLLLERASGRQIMGIQMWVFIINFLKNKVTSSLQGNN
jgi:hypothetical protein